MPQKQVELAHMLANIKVALFFVAGVLLLALLLGVVEIVFTKSITRAIDNIRSEKYRRFWRVFYVIALLGACAAIWAFWYINDRDMQSVRP